MDSSIQIALQNLIKNQASPDEIELLQQSFSNGQIFIGGNVRNSVIIVGSGKTVQLSAEDLQRLAVSNNRSLLHQLPQPPLDFVGREQELEEVLKSIDKNGGTYIGGLFGMGGIGKTATGLVIAHRLIEKYPDAQFFIDMRGTSKNPLKPVDVMMHVLQSFHPTGDFKNVTEAELVSRYRTVLAQKKSILFLDNAHDASQITPLLPPNNCFMLVTSRLHFVVPGLHSIYLDILKEKDAVRLLVEICPRLTRNDAGQIAQLCGYLPIAMRLAASYLFINATLTPKDYIAQLSDKNKRLHSLQVKGSDTSIEASFAQSYQQLTLKEQRYWVMLAVFPTSFKRDAIASVWDVDDETTREVVAKLCRYSLLEYDSISDRYRLHDLLVEFASTKLTRNKKTSARLRHFQCYRDVWFSAEELYIQGDRNIDRGLTLFDTEYTQINAAYEWAIENGSTSQDVLPIIKHIPASTSILRLRLHPNSQIKWFEAALVAAQKLNDSYSQNKLLGNIGVAYVNLGANREAIEYFEQALTIARAIGDQQHQGYWLGNIGIAYINLGENRKAIEYFEQALTIAREINDRLSEGVWLGNIGSAHFKLGESRKAIEYYEPALEIARAIGDRIHESEWLNQIGESNIEINNAEQARENLEHALFIARELGFRQIEAQALFNLAKLSQIKNNVGGALRYAQESHSIFEILESPESGKVNQFIENQKSEIYIALQDLIENKATSGSIDLIRQALSSGQISVEGNVENPVFILGSENAVRLPAEALNILDYASDNIQSRSANEVKILFVGQGSVGKTSLILRLTQDIFDANEAKTEGISVIHWILGSDIRLNIWDFGGQEIMHATHQFFLTKHSLYLLVLDSRLTQEENRVEYWLKMIQSFGDRSPVLVVGNKIDQHPLDIDRSGLQKKHPEIVGFLETSAATGTGIEECRTAIIEQVGKLPHVHDLLPKTWFDVKTQLEKLGNEHNYITYDNYLELCADNKVSDETSQRTLISFLHDLGVVLHFQDDPRLEALGILNPQWVTNGVYKIFNAHALFRNNGALTVSMLDEILNLPEYPRGKRLFIVDMMKKFELCYDLEPDKTFLVPDLLPKDEPAELNFNGIPAFEYTYPVLPSSVITRFIVRMNQHIHADCVWRTGVLLKIGENVALIKADIEDRKITITIDGLEHTRRDALSAIRYQIDEIHNSIKGLDAQKRVPIHNAPNAEPLKYEYLLKLERAGQETLLVENGNDLVNINVREVLSAIEKETQRKETGGNVTNIYVGGNFDGNLTVGDGNQSIKDSYNKITSAKVDPELKETLKQLVEAVDAMSKSLPEEQSAEAVEDLSKLVEEATKPKPNQRWYSVSIEGLIKAAENVEKVGQPVINLSRKVLSLLTGNVVK